MPFFFSSQHVLVEKLHSIFWDKSYLIAEKEKQDHKLDAVDREEITAPSKTWADY